MISVIRIRMQPMMDGRTRGENREHKHRACQQPRAGSAQTSRLSASGDEESMHDLVETILLIGNSSSEVTVSGTAYSEARTRRIRCVDSASGKRTSLNTSDEESARQIIAAKNQAERQPVLNLQIARAYLMGSDTEI